MAAFDRLTAAPMASQAENHPFDAADLLKGTTCKPQIDLAGLEQQSQVMAAQMRKTMCQAVNALIALYGPDQMLEAYNHQSVDEDLRNLVQEAVKSHKAGKPFTI
jgi:hypothetical protein